MESMSNTLPTKEVANKTRDAIKAHVSAIEEIVVGSPGASAMLAFHLSTCEEETLSNVALLFGKNDGPLTVEAFKKIDGEGEYHLPTAANLAIGLIRTVLFRTVDCILSNQADLMRPGQMLELVETVMKFAVKRQRSDLAVAMMPNVVGLKTVTEIMLKLKKRIERDGA